MNDFKRFLSWYLGARTRLGRGVFKVVFFLAFIPVIILKINSGVSEISSKANDYAPLVSMLENLVNGNVNNDNDYNDIDAVLNKSKQTRNITRQLMHDFNFDASMKPKAKNDVGFDFSDIFNLIIFIALIPIMQMRLRDVGKWGDSMWWYIGFIYVGVIADSVKEFLGIELPFAISAAATVSSFIVTSWLCMAKSKKGNFSNGKSDTYMPGDIPDDPY